MLKSLLTVGTLLLLLASSAQAEDPVTCKGSITSKQGQGLVVKTFRFEIEGVTGSDTMDVLEKCKKITLQKQNRAARANPALGFRRFSDVDLDCTKGTEKFQVRRTLQTGP
jgi:hypothetical protein